MVLDRARLMDPQYKSDENRDVTYALTQVALAGAFAITYLTTAGEPVTTFSGMFVDDVQLALPCGSISPTPTPAPRGTAAPRPRPTPRPRP